MTHRPNWYPGTLGIKVFFMTNISNFLKFDYCLVLMHYHPSKQLR